MTNNQQLADQDRKDLKQITKEIIKSHKNLQELIDEAAEILELSGRYPDTTIISSRLKLAWPDISTSTIEKALPGKYKRTYKRSKPADDVADSAELEVLFRFQDLFTGLASAVKSIIKAYKKDPEIAETIKEAIRDTSETNRDKLRKKIEAESRKITDVHNLIVWIKNRESDLSYIQEQTDMHHKIDDLVALQMRLWMTNTPIRKVAKQMHISSKWASAIAQDDNLKKRLELLRSCPSCDKDIAQAFNTAMKHEILNG